ncbi:serine/threonine protein phosphatase [Sphingomonas sp.]|uniref:serine/threonine protein phosphatase n=1 Tax=Sphingomonas sp. TaxID=28214 RepID=UPI002DD6661F|nr:serine/threonine protein phosphatase [Sphingomonas sp.]
MKRAALKTALSLVAMAAAASANATTYRQGDCGDFSVAMIPDTQNYVDYRRQKWSGFAFDAIEQMNTQMWWIARNARSSGGDIVFATHVGDVWQHYSEWMDPAHAARGFKWMPNGGSETAMSPKVHTRAFEIPAAAQAFRLIEGRLPFSVVAGNHDYDALWTDPAHPPRPDLDRAGVRHIGGLTGFGSVFSARSSFFAGQPWYVDSRDDGADSAQLFTAGQCRFLHIGLQYHAPRASLAWAAQVIRRHPGLPTIVTTHDYLGRDGRRNMKSNPLNSKLDPSDGDPEIIWNDFVSRHDQIFLVLSGHVSGQAFSIDTNRAGNRVYQMMADYQSRGQTAKDAGTTGATGDGWLRVLKFRLDGDRPRIDVRTYSTHYGKFSSEIAEYASWYKVQDGQGELTDAAFLGRDEFTIQLDDFHRRFGKGS